MQILPQKSSDCADCMMVEIGGIYICRFISLLSSTEHFIKTACSSSPSFEFFLLGEKASFYGEPCDNCGKYPRTPYVNYDN